MAQNLNTTPLNVEALQKKILFAYETEAAKGEKSSITRNLAAIRSLNHENSQLITAAQNALPRQTGKNNAFSLPKRNEIHVPTSFIRICNEDIDFDNPDFEKFRTQNGKALHHQSQHGEMLYMPEEGPTNLLKGFGENVLPINVIYDNWMAEKRKGQAWLDYKDAESHTQNQRTAEKIIKCPVYAGHFFFRYRQAIYQSAQDTGFPLGMNFASSAVLRATFFGTQKAPAARKALGHDSKNDYE
ncbi:hypothetical protein FQR65_LT17739 [Abscondita terminalis]|nr:hypothetical protein FQR65_LT17739 [Abscondita terminalis]